MEEKILNRPIPKPRQRVNVSTDQNAADNALLKKYENIIIDDSNVKKTNNYDKNEIYNFMTHYKDHNKIIIDKTIDKVDLSDPHDENIQKPIPAPRNNVNAPLYPNLFEMTQSMKDGPSQKSTGAIRKAPQVPSSMKTGNINNLNIDIRKPNGLNATHSERQPSSPRNANHNAMIHELNSNFDKGKSPSNQTINSTNNNNNTTSSTENASPKYKTSSPGSILKSLGTTSKQLTESIGERLGAKTKSIFSSNNSSGSSGSTNKLKNVRLNFTMGRNSKKKDELPMDRPQTLPVNDEIFKSISFNSPLGNKANNYNDLSKAKSSELPSYEDALSCNSSSHISHSDASSCMSLNSTQEFERNSSLTQSLYSNPVPQRRFKQSPKFSIFKNKSESNLLDENLYNNLSKSTPSSSMESLPCPNFPAPVLRQTEGIYGKLKSVPENEMNDDIRLRKNSDYENVQIRSKPIMSNRATINTDESHNSRIFSRQCSMVERVHQDERRISPTSSWSYYDVSNVQQNEDSDASSPEPIYANDESNQPVYGKICEMETNLLKPGKVVKPARALRSSLKNAQTPSIDSIVEEFDPYIQERVDDICRHSKNKLSIIENLLGENTYGQIDNNNVASDDDDEDVLPPARLEHLVKPPRRAPRPPQNSKPKSVIIHQNLNLPSDSMENILDESAIEPYLVQGSDDENINTVEPVDLRRPEPPKTHWFVDNNSNSATNSRTKNNVDRAFKGPAIKLPKNDGELPTYNDVLTEISAEKELQKSTNNHDAASTSSGVPTTPVAGKKSKFSNVLNLRRKSSMKEGKSEVRTMLEMIPKPILSAKNVTYKGHLLKLPSGVIEDIMKELSPRNVEIRDKKFTAYLEASLITVKEQFLFKYISSIQCVIKHRFNNEGGTEIYCFEINTALPKNVDKQPTLQQAMSNPNMIMTSTNSGNTKSIRISYVFGIYKKQERNIWMQKLIQNMTDVFPPLYSMEFTRAGWCYLKKSISSEWSGAWLMLSKRKLIFYSDSEKKLEVMDLRKARCIGYKESDETINNLHVEKGPTMLLDCPPYTVYFIMSSMRETKIWRNCIRESAHNNGTTLKHQQLTKDAVPVLVDKCINFVYAHGSMSEGIYRKPGSTNNVQKLLTQFKTDAFSVQILRSDYNEHDVSSALKKFMRELPEPLIGKLANSFIGVSQMKAKPDKLEAYGELLKRLPEIEYQTLKKLMGHLNFIQSQKFNNRMNVENLAMIWGPTLLQDQSVEGMQYSQSEANVITDLIAGYKVLFQMSADEIQTEKIMLEVLQKYHAAAENLSDTVKQSGDLKIWVILDAKPENISEEKPQANVTLTPTKTAFDVCTELAAKMHMAVVDITLYEYILNGELYRPLHYNEKVLDTVLRWTYWPESDRKTNFISLRPKTLMLYVEHAISKLPSVSPNSEIKFADRKTRSLKSYTLELFEKKITVLKKEKNGDVKLKEVDVQNVIAYLGCEKKRDLQMRWAITLIEKDFKKRTRESPYIGHVLAGTNANDQNIWFTSILYSLYKNDVVPDIRRSRHFI